MHFEKKIMYYAKPRVKKLEMYLYITYNNIIIIFNKT